MSPVTGSFAEKRTDVDYSPAGSNSSLSLFPWARGFQVALAAEAQPVLMAAL